MLSGSFTHQSTIGEIWENRINYEMNQIETNFTVMINLRSKVRIEKFFVCDLYKVKGYNMIYIKLKQLKGGTVKHLVKHD